MHGKREQKSSRSPAKQSWSVGKFGPMPRAAKLHRLSIAIAERLHSEIASASLIHDCAKGIEWVKVRILAQDGPFEPIPRSRLSADPPFRTIVLGRVNPSAPANFISVLRTHLKGMDYTGKKTSSSRSMTILYTCVPTTSSSATPSSPAVHTRCSTTLSQKYTLLYKLPFSSPGQKYKIQNKRLRAMYPPKRD